MGALGSLASVVRVFTKEPPVTASLAPLDEEGTAIDNKEQGFQYFPETVTDTRGVNWVSKNIPGGSHPLYQFVNGTDRVINFTAIFTADENPDEGDFFDKLTKGFSLSNLLTDKSNKKKHVTDVAAAITWLRKFTYPNYSRLGHAKAPPLIRLYLPNSGINGQIGGVVTPDSIDVIMTQCDVTYESFHNYGHPRIASVNLSFNEVIQVGQNWQFVGGDIFDNFDTYKREPVRKTNTTAGGISSITDALR